MHAPTILAALCSVSVAVAAPRWPHFYPGSNKTSGRDAISDYFNLLAQKVSTAGNLDHAPVCDLSKARMPNNPAAPLPAPGADVELVHVAIGRGTQNYTCDQSNPTAAPTPVGAVATLFNASCLAAAYPDLLHLIPRLALQFDLPPFSDSTDMMLGPTNMVVSGKHYFTDPTTPFFNLDTEYDQLGETSCTKLNSSNAPADSPRGRQGEPAVPWLHLGSKSDATDGLHDIYRVKTAGGSAPATCKGMPASFEVQYAAEYWFFSSS